MSNYWYYGPGTDGNTPTLLLTGAEVADATPYVGTVSQSGEWSNSGYTDSSSWPWDDIRSEIKAVLTLESNPISMADSSSMYCMFDVCSSLASIDTSGFNTSKVTSMYYMFRGCSPLTSIDVSGFDTSKVTNMRSMFGYCSSLTSIDVSGFNTSLVTRMDSMFSHCSSIVSLDLSGFDTSKVTNMDSMFNSCSSLVSLDVSKFDTSKVTSRANMFLWSSALRIIDISDSMENILPKLPSATYYNVETGESAPRGSLTKGTWVRDEADLDLVSTMIQNRQAVRSVRHIVNGLSKRVVALETAVSSLKQ